jgi:hypothetical protein
MGFYSRLSALIPDQSCVFYAENAKFVFVMHVGLAIAITSPDINLAPTLLVGN